MAGVGWTQIALVSVGALSGAIPTYVVDRARDKRDRITHWRDLRRENAVRFLTILSRLTHEITLLGHLLPKGSVPEGGFWHGLVDLPDGQARIVGQEINVLRDEMTAQIEEMKLLGRENEVEAAKKVLGHVNALLYCARGGNGRHDPEFVRLRQELRESKANLRAEIRHSLDLRG